MKSKTGKAITALVLVAIAAILFIALRSGDESPEPVAQAPKPVQPEPGGGNPDPQPPEAEPSLTTIRVRDGGTVGGVAEIEATSGDQVRFRFASDQAGELHIHGYEIEKDIEAGGEVSVSFAAELEGTYEIELHGDSEFQVAELIVSPG